MNMQKMDGIARIDKVMAEFEVWLDATLFPVPKMKVKVLQRSNDFAAFSNLSRRDRSTRAPDGVAGLGSDADEAIRDLLTRFVADVREHLPDGGFVESDFVWSDPEDF